MKKWLESVYTDGTNNFVSNPNPKKGETIRVRIRVIENKELKHILLRTKFNGLETLFEMKKENKVNGLQYYYCEFTVYEDVCHYHFYLVTDKKIYYYNQLEIVDYIPNEVYDFKILTNYDSPSWVKGTVFYQIFPERFCNGNKENDVKDGEYTFDGHKTMQIKDWNMTPLDYQKSFCLDFYGGDLEGIEKKIPYLKKLGVTALYLNPIFYAATVHKYDCIDYFQVDPHFGGNEALENLTKKLHENGIKIILDVSINHTGIAHKWFNKDGTFFPKIVGAYNNKNSLEREYYDFDENNNYRAWVGVKTLPALNYESLKLREIMYNGKESFVRKWLSAPYSIDGYRFDVGDNTARNNYSQLHHVIWPQIRNVIKSINKEAYILAEDWSDCGEFLKGDEWDSSMNYFGFARPVREFVGEVDLFNKRNPILNKKIKMTAKELENRFKAHLCKLPFTIMENQFNLLDSHDVARLHNCDFVIWEEYRGAVICMFTMIGAPSIYYGDEAEIDGITSTNEGCRYPMPWNKDFESGKFFKLYSDLTYLKKNSDALSNGGIKFLSSDGYTISFARIGKEEVVLTVFSTDSKSTLVKIPYDILGKKDLPLVDYFKEKLEYKFVGNNAYLVCPPHKSYILVM